MKEGNIMEKRDKWKNKKRSIKTEEWEKNKRGVEEEGGGDRTWKKETDEETIEK